MKLTHEQQAFIEAIKSTTQNICLEAVAGSGKTTTLVEASKHLPAPTLALAFNKKIQETMAERFPSTVLSKTFNSLGHFIWQKSHKRLFLSSRKLGKLTSEILPPNSSKEDWHAVKDLATSFKANGLIPPDLEQEVHIPHYQLATPDTIAELATTYDLSTNPTHHQIALAVLTQSITKAFEGLVDFDDQIYMPTYFSPTDHFPSYKAIMVDEAQDLSQIQHDFLARFPAEPRIIAVGDPFQAIYGWRGAQADSMELLAERFACKNLPLSTCFRCPQLIIEAAQRILPIIRPAYGAPLGTLLNLHTNWTPQSLARGSVILCRNNAPLVSLAYKLIKANIPSYFTGRDIAKTLLAKLKQIQAQELDCISTSIRLWRETLREEATLKEQFWKIAEIEDTANTLLCIHEHSHATNWQDLALAIEELFRKEYSPDAIELSTIHRAKGKEWQDVYILDKHLLPAPWLLKLVKKNPNLQWLIEQEENLHYVAITRSLSTLTYITSEEHPNE